MTETLDTTQLRQGDVVLNHGMRILLDQPANSWTGQDGRTVIAFSGKVLNPEDVRDDRLLWSFLHTDEWNEQLRRWTRVFTGRYTIQGNDLARWTVESRCADSTGDCLLHGGACTPAAVAVSA